MRQAGTIETRPEADLFANYLLSLGISSKVEASNGQWAIWIHDENQIDRSRQELDQFRAQPSDPRYKDAEAAARTARREAAEKKRQAERNFIDMRNEWASPWRRRPVTVVMIVTCVALALGVLGNLDDALMFSMPAIQAGEVWRLITPIFLHASLGVSPWHLIFNMFWLYDLGTLIERRIGSVRFSLLVLIVALVSNYTQFVAQGPNFVGMSGVVYGLFGYCWVRGRVEPTSGLYLQPNVAFIMLAWFVICAAGLIGDVANWAHGGGLVAGCVLGYLPHILKTLRQNT